MGHGVAAALLATLVVGSLRNSRRGGASLVEQATNANLALVQHANVDQFVTTQLLSVDFATGVASFVNAGHMNPLLVRGGKVAELALRADLVLGVDAGRTYRQQDVQLQVDDRLALVTDGMFERDAAAAEIEILLATLGPPAPARGGTGADPARVARLGRSRPRRRDGVAPGLVRNHARGAP